MKVGVLSDSHGELGNLKEAAKWLIEEGVSVLIHLGDDYDDAKVLDEFGVRVIKVPGVFESYYHDPSIKNRIIEEFEGKRVLISHTEELHKNDPPSEVKELINPQELIAKKEVHLVLVGHSHIPKIEEKEGVLILNPGHLKSEDKKGYAPTFGLIDFKNKKVQVITLNKKVTIIQKSFD